MGSLLPFKAPYCWKLHKQIVIDLGGSVNLDSQSKQLYMKSKLPAWIFSHTRSQRLNRHLNSTSAIVCHLCCIGSVKGPCNIFSEVERWAPRCTTAGCLPSQPELRGPQSFYINIAAKPQKWAENEKWNRWVLYVCGERLKSGWAVSREQSRWGEWSLREAAGRATSSLCLLHSKFSFWTFHYFQMKRIWKKKTVWHLSWSHTYSNNSLDKEY